MARKLSRPAPAAVPRSRAAHAAPAVQHVKPPPQEGPPSRRRGPIQIGFWRATDAPHLPDPRKWVAPMTAKERDTLVAYLEGAPTVNPQRGLSVCRICGKPNGAAERTDGVYLWPTGFTHYVKGHGVRPPQDFIAHVFAAQGRPAARPTPGVARPVTPRTKASPARTPQVERLPRASAQTALRDALSRWESSDYTDQKAAQVLMKHTGLNVWDRYHGTNPVDPGFYAGELEREVEASLEADHLGLTAAQEAIVQRTITRAREALHAGEDYEDNVAGDRAVYLADDLTDAGVYTEDPVAVLVYARRRLRAALQPLSRGRHEALTAAEYGLLGADLLAPDPVPGFPGPVTAAVLGHHVLERLPTRVAPSKSPPDAPPGGG